MDFQYNYCLLCVNSHEWPRQNFSLQNENNIKHTSDENKDKISISCLLVDPILNALS